MPAIRPLRRRVAHGAESEIYRNLYTRILLRAGRHDGGVVLGITSAAQGEGKTTTALNLARVFAEDRGLAPNPGQARNPPGSADRSPALVRRITAEQVASDVLIIDCNEGRGSASRELGVQELPGLTDYLMGACTVSDAIRVTKTARLNLIPLGGHADARMVLLGSDGMRDLLVTMRARYALVVVDLPPILAGAETLAMVPLTDHLVMVVRSGRVSQQDLKRALDLLASIDPKKLIGAVLNDRRRTLPKWIDQLF